MWGVRAFNPKAGHNRYARVSKTGHSVDQSLHVHGRHLWGGVDVSGHSILAIIRLQVHGRHLMWGALERAKRALPTFGAFTPSARSVRIMALEKDDLLLKTGTANCGGIHSKRTIRSSKTGADAMRRRSKSSFSIAWICTVLRRIPASASTN